MLKPTVLIVDDEAGVERLSGVLRDEHIPSMWSTAWRLPRPALRARPTTSLSWTSGCRGWTAG